MIQEKQELRFSAEDIALIKSMLGGKKEKLYAIRNHFWQFDNTKAENDLLEFTDEEKKLLTKVFLPEPATDMPIFKQTGMYTSLYHIRELQPAIALAHIQANDILIFYITQQLDELLDGEVEIENHITLSELPEPLGSGQEELRLVNMLAYHNIMVYIEGRMNELKVFSEPVKEETEEEKKKRELANSTK